MNKSGYDRLEGYKNAMRALDLASGEGMHTGDFIKQSGFFAMQQLLQRKPDVGFCSQ